MIERGIEICGTGKRADSEIDPEPSKKAKTPKKKAPVTPVEPADGQPKDDEIDDDTVCKVADELTQQFKGVSPPLRSNSDAEESSDHGENDRVAGAEERARRLKESDDMVFLPASYSQSSGIPFLCQS
ncbi:hypothetical protein PGT21_011674 [Puccinia graminis f. sp. tritici]|uniref:Uncharacterized protein n=1 Tax=Puccinia graminis f. sp. tritici TaxID=56615 RepID=A0A5B0RQ01_PUCGR|nr:hypothetical protein PGT21_011674 [Puccinia graminis f. sp. tritici]KAA1126724.1 hypothetical protein PGTUg99_009057 [Puccinia graminis f. sp. tritici]